jgi:hypothetical protein
LNIEKLSLEMKDLIDHLKDPKMISKVKFDEDEAVLKKRLNDFKLYDLASIEKTMVSKDVKDKIY